LAALPILWRQTARGDLAAIIRYIASHNVSAARRLRDIIETAVLVLAEHPFLYRAGRVPGTRELVAHPNYIVVYRVTATTVEIVNIVHARQRYP
jgi:toxin ParE1/3/4